MQGKEKGTEWDKEFVEYCVKIVEEKIPNITTTVSRKDIMKGLGLNTYEDFVYLAGKGKGFEEVIRERVSTPGARKMFFKKMYVDKTKVEEIEKEIDGEKDREIDGEAAEEEVMTVEEASKISGIPAEKLEEVLGKGAKIVGINGLSGKSMKDLEKLLNRTFSQDKGVMIKVAGEDGNVTKNKGYLLSSEGEKLYEDGETGNTDLISDLVADGAVGDEIQDVNKTLRERDVECKKIEYEDPFSGKDVTQYAQKGTEKEVIGYEREAQVILDELEAKLREIQNSPGEEYEKLDRMGEATFNASQKLADSQVGYGVFEPQSIDSLESRASNYWTESEKARVLSVGVKTVETIAAAGLAGSIVQRAPGRDLREQDHDGHENGRVPKNFI